MSGFDKYFETQVGDETGLSPEETAEKNRIPSPVISDSEKDEEQASIYDSLGDKQSFVFKSEKEYWNEINPETGERWDIPLLSTASDGYRASYVAMMHLKATQPEYFFSKIMKGE